MKKVLIFYYLLFVLLVTGAFAAMAHHNFGVKLCGLACLGFVIVFGLDVVSRLKEKTPDRTSWLNATMLIVMTGVALLFMLRNYSLDLPMSTLLMNVLLTLLLVLVITQAVIQWNRPEMITWRMQLIMYYVALISLLVAFMIGERSVTLRIVVTVVGVLCFTMLIVTVIRRRKVIGEEVTPNFEGQKSNVILFASLLMGLLFLLHSADVLPALYRGSMPYGYHELVDQSGLQGADKAAEFEKNHDQLVSKWRNL